ncbi:MAG: efflux RND transporter periplasmic adaptor subunit [Gammaproteobacteria bacterium]|nr:efflux RND transporter periplasmic adaptor subunit [Gammaproteobacteria bacterium]
MTANNSSNQKMEKRLSVTLLVVLIVALLILGNWALNIISAHLSTTNASYARENDKPIPVKVIEVEAAPVKATLVTQATLVENQELPIYPGSNAMVSGVRVQVGDLVKKGDVLVSFYEDQLKAKVELAKSVAEIAEEEYEEAQRNFTRVESLFAKNLVGKDEFTKATLAEKQAKSKLINNQYEVQKAEFEYSQVELKAPVGGVVTAVSAFENTQVRMTMPIVTLSVTNPIYVEAKVAQRYFGELSLGQPVSVSLDAFPERTITAEILRLGYEVDRISDTVSVYAKVDNPDLILRPGMGGIATIELAGGSADTLRIPAIALLGSNGRSGFVFVIDETQKAHLKEVSIIGYEQGYVGIRSGLSPRDRIVVVGQQALKDGDRVEMGNAS